MSKKNVKAEYAKNFVAIQLKASLFIHEIRSLFEICKNLNINIQLCSSKSTFSRSSNNVYLKKL